MVISKTIFDTGSDSSLVSNNIVKRLELDVDKTNALNLSGVATKSDTMGTTYGLGISIYDSDNDKTIEDNFMVIKSDKDFLLLGVLCPIKTKMEIIRFVYVFIFGKNVPIPYCKCTISS